MLSQGLKVVSALVSPLLMLGLLIAGLEIDSQTRANADQGADDHLTHAGTEFGALLDDTQTLVGGAWDNRDDPTGRGCVIPFAVAGTSYPALRLGETPRNVASALQGVTDLWTDHGLAVERTNINEVAQLTGRGERDEVFILRVSDQATTLIGESACLPD